MEQTKEYYAFISYKREDEKWAKWLAYKLEHYHLPTTLNGKDLPKNLRPIFRDVDELSAGNLPKQIYQALSISKNLIVVCSPRSAKSEWVNKEIEDFIKIKGGKAENIYPFIIQGAPFAKNLAEECFPTALKELSESEERLGGNVNEQGGRNAAVVKIIAGMLGIGFDSLWQKYERGRRKKRNVIVATLTFFLIAILCVTAYIWKININLTRTNEAKSQAQSRAAAEAAIRINKDGDSYLARKIAVAALDISYTPQAEAALRQSSQYNNAILHGHNSPVGIIEIDVNNEITSISWDNVRVWDFYSGRCKQVNKHHYDSGKVYWFADDFNKDSTYRVLPYLHNVVIRNVSTGEDTRIFVGHSDGVNQTKYTHDNKYIISSSDDGTVRIWQLDSTNYVKTLKGHSNQVNSVVYSHSGKRIVSASSDSTICIWDAESGRRLKTLLGHTRWINTAEYSPDDKKIVSASADSTIRIWEESTGHCLRVIKGHKGWVNSVAFSPNGKEIISTSSDSTIRIWDVVSGQCKYVLKEEKASDFGKAFFSPDGKKIVSESMNDIYIWDTATRKCVRTLPGHHWGVNDVKFSPNGKYIISVSDDHTIRIWDAKSWECLNVLVGPDCVNSVSFSPDSKYVILSSKDNTMQIWHISSGINIQTLYGHSDWVVSSSFSPDGKHIVSGGRDNYIHIWEFCSLEKLIEDTHERFKDNPLTPEERRKYYLE